MLCRIAVFYWELLSTIASNFNCTIKIQNGLIVCVGLKEANAKFKDYSITVQTTVQKI